jgi:hypothetical protein
VSVSKKKSTSTAAPAHAATTTAAGETASTTTPTPTDGGITFVKLPSAAMKVPAIPQGFVATNGTDYRGLLPKKQELAVLADAVTEFKRFRKFTRVFGSTVPKLSAVTQIFAAAEAWSTLRNQTSEWDLFCRTQEGLSWKAARGVIAKMKPAFQLASSSDDSLPVQNPSITALLGAATDIANRGLATRVANKQAEAKGLAPTHGKANKKAAKLNAAVAAALAAHTANATPAPVAVVAAAPPATPQTTAAPALVVNPALNGAAVTGH